MGNDMPERLCKLVERPKLGEVKLVGQHNAEVFAK
jgi:hypothetical protein